jgi:hypothetical protein
MPNLTRLFNTAGGSGRGPFDTPTTTETDAEDLGAEPLEGSGFEDEDPEPEFEEGR